jgi:hypothetical protein
VIKRTSWHSCSERIFGRRSHRIRSLLIQHSTPVLGRSRFTAYAVVCPVIVGALHQSNPNRYLHTDLENLNKQGSQPGVETKTGPRRSSRGRKGLPDEIIYVTYFYSKNCRKVKLRDGRFCWWTFRAEQLMATTAV